MQNIYDKLKTYFPAEIRRIIWQLTIENHNSISYNDIVVSSDNPRDCEEIYFRFQGGYKLLFELTYKGVPNNTENPYAYMEIPYTEDINWRGKNDCGHFEYQSLNEMLRDWLDKLTKNESKEFNAEIYYIKYMML